MRRTLLLLISSLIAGTLVVSAPCLPASNYEAERAVMRYVASLTERWGTRQPTEFYPVATRPHAAQLRYTWSPSRAIFSPYLQWLQIERVEARCREVLVELTVATGYKPTLALPRPVVITLVHIPTGLKVAETVGR